jgi:hypothetical protein
MVKTDDSPPEGPALDQGQAHAAIQRILGLPHAIIFTRHCRQRALERDFSTEDVWRVLRHGSVGPKADWDEKRQEWVYRVTGRDYDNEPLTVKVVIDEENEVLRVVSAHE